MGTITINGKKVEFTDEKNVLTIIRKAGFEVPTLCYQPELSIFGACRLCMVEDDRGRFFASCSEEPRDGMVIYTHTERLRKNRKLIVELLLAAHCRDCTTCDKHGRCKLQKLAYQLGINNVRFENHREIQPVDFSSPAIVRDPNKCILCGCCVRACSELQGIGVLAFAHRGTDATVTTAFDRKMAMTNCVSCGQCRVVCPTGALTIHHNMTDVWQALGDKNTRVVAQIAPAVRVAIGEAFGLPKGENSMGKVVAALHRMGFDEVFDTAYTADLTIMEESAEFLERGQGWRQSAADDLLLPRVGQVRGERVSGIQGKYLHLPFSPSHVLRHPEGLLPGRGQRQGKKDRRSLRHALYRQENGGGAQGELHPRGKGHRLRAHHHRADPDDRRPRHQL